MEFTSITQRVILKEIPIEILALLRTRQEIVYCLGYIPLRMTSVLVLNAFAKKVAS